MSEFVRVTDDVKPKREYTIPRSVFEAFPGDYTEVEKPACGADGTPLEPKFTPESLSSSGQKATTTEKGDDR